MQENNFNIGDDFQGEITDFSSARPDTVTEDLVSNGFTYPELEVPEVNVTPFKGLDIPEFKGFTGFDITGSSLPTSKSKEPLSGGELLTKMFNDNLTPLDIMTSPIYSATQSEVERYQDPTLPYNPNYDMEEIYAKAHPFSLGDSFNKMYETTKINLFSNFKNIASAFSGDTSNLYDNSHLAELSTAMENLELDMPQYFTSDERDNPLALRNWNSTVKSFIPAAGTSIAAIPDMLLGHAAFAVAGAVSGGLLGAAGSQGLAFARDAKVLSGAFKNMYKYSKALTSAKNAAQTIGGTVVSGVLYANGEAGLQARMNADNYIKKEQKSYWDKYGTLQGFDEAKIQESADKMAKSTFILNTALIGASQYVQLPTLLRGKISTNLAKNQLPGFKRIEGITTAVRKQKRKYLWELGKDAASEGLEETGQSVIDDATTEYYTGNSHKDNVVGSIVHGVTERLTQEGLVEFLGGAFIGGGMSLGGQAARGVSSRVYNKPPHTKERIAQFNSSSNNLINSITKVANNEEAFVKSINEGDLLKANDYLDNSVFHIASESFRNNTSEARLEYFNDLKVLPTAQFNQLLKVNVTEAEQALLVDNLIEDYQGALNIHSSINTIAPINPFAEQSWFKKKLKGITDDPSEQRVIAGKAWFDYKNILAESFYKEKKLGTRIKDIQDRLRNTYGDIDIIANPNLSQAVVDYKVSLNRLKALKLEKPTAEQQQSLNLLEELNTDISVQAKYKAIIDHLKFNSEDQKELDELLQSKAVLNTFSNTTDLDNTAYQKEQIENILDYIKLDLDRGAVIKDVEDSDIPADTVDSDDSKIDSILGKDKKTASEAEALGIVTTVHNGEQVWRVPTGQSFSTPEEAIAFMNNTDTETTTESDYDFGDDSTSAGEPGGGNAADYDFGDTGDDTAEGEDSETLTPEEASERGEKTKEAKEKRKKEKKLSAKQKLNALYNDITVAKQGEKYVNINTGDTFTRVTSFLDNKNTDLLDLFNVLQQEFTVKGTSVSLSNQDIVTQEIEKLLAKGYKSPDKFTKLNLPKEVLDLMSDPKVMLKLDKREIITTSIGDRLYLTLEGDLQILYADKSKPSPNPISTKEFEKILRDYNSKSFTGNTPNSSSIDSVKTELINLKTSTVIGTEIDTIIRDFFVEGETKVKATKYKPVMSKGQFKGFLKSLNELKDFFDSRGETVYTDEAILYDIEQGIAGTPDIITLDKKGDFRLYDIKTMALKQLGANPLAYWDSSEVKGKATTSKRDRYSDQLSAYSILANNTHGIVFKEIGIIPIGVKYEPGEAVSKIEPEFIKITSNDISSPYISNDTQVSSKVNKEGEETLALKYKRFAVIGKDGRTLELNKTKKKKAKKKAEKEKNTVSIESEITRAKEDKSSVLNKLIEKANKKLEKKRKAELKELKGHEKDYLKKQKELRKQEDAELEQIKRDYIASLEKEVQEETVEENVNEEEDYVYSYLLEQMNEVNNSYPDISVSYNKESATFTLNDKEGNIIIDEVESLAKVVEDILSIGFRERVKLNTEPNEDTYEDAGESVQYEVTESKYRRKKVDKSKAHPQNKNNQKYHNKEKGYITLAAVNVDDYTNLIVGSKYFSSKAVYRVTAIHYSTGKDSTKIIYRKRTLADYQRGLDNGLKDSQIFSTSKEAKKKYAKIFSNFNIATNDKGWAFNHSHEALKSMYKKGKLSSLPDIAFKPNVSKVPKKGSFYIDKGDSKLYKIDHVKGSEGNYEIALKAAAGGYSLAGKYLTQKDFESRFRKFDFDKDFTLNGLDLLMEKHKGFKVDRIYKVGKSGRTTPLKVYTAPEGFVLRNSGGTSIKTIAFGPGSKPVVYVASKIDRYKDIKGKGKFYYRVDPRSPHVRKQQAFNGIYNFITLYNGSTPQEVRERMNGSYSNTKDSKLRLVSIDTLSSDLFKAATGTGFKALSKVDLVDKLKKLNFTQAEINNYYSNASLVEQYKKENKGKSNSILENGLGKLFKIQC